MAYEEIKKEIVEHIKKRYSQLPEDDRIRIKNELNILSSTDGLESKNNLEVFYNTWKNHKNKIEHKNDINSLTDYYLDMT